MATIKIHSEKNIKILKTSALYFSFFALGLCLAIPGPTLLDLQQIVKTDTGKIAFIYLSRSASALVGSLVGGILFDTVTKKQLLLVTCNMVLALSIFATPWTRSVEGLSGTWAIGGFALGSLVTGSNVMCLRIWGKESPPYLQALHFMYGIGAFFAPLIAEPFLSNCNIHVSLQQNDSEIHNPVFSSFYYENRTGILCDNNSIPPVTYAYSIIGVVTAFASFFILILAVLFPDQEKQKKADAEDEKTTKNEKHSLIYIITVSFMAQILIIVYCGVEIGYGQMIMTFAVKGDLKLSKSAASFITAFYWGVFTFFRGLAVFLTRMVSVFTLIFGDLIVVIVSAVILVIYGSVYVEALWVGTFLLAAGCASFFPSVISWVESYIHVNNKIASLFVIAATFGEMAVPLIVSRYIESEPHMLMYICLGFAIAGSVVAVCLWLLMTKKGKRT